MRSLRGIALAYLAVATVSAAIGAAPVVVAVTGSSLALPNLAIDQDAARRTAAALGSLVVTVAFVHLASAVALVRGQPRGWSPAVVATGLTAAMLTVLVLGFVFQRGTGGVPYADLAAVVLGTFGLAYATLGVLIATRPPPGR